MLFGCEFRGLLGAGLLVFALKAIYAASRIDQFLFACKERVAARANFNADVAFMGGTRLEGVLTRTDNVDLVVGGMDSSFHFVTFRGKFHANTNPRKPPIGWSTGDVGCY